MKTGQAGLALIKTFEGLRLKAYPDPATGGAPWTIGYGLTSAAGIVPVVPGMTITAAQAEEYLVKALVKYEAAVSKALKRTPSQNEFDAMVSLCYNIGPGNFAGSSVVRYFNAGDEAMAASSFLLWNKAGGKVMDGLKRRREAERKLFRTQGPPVTQPAPPAPVPPSPPVVEPAPQPPATAGPVGLWARLKAWLGWA